MRTDAAQDEQEEEHDERSAAAHPRGGWWPASGFGAGWRGVAHGRCAAVFCGGVRLSEEDARTMRRVRCEPGRWGMRRSLGCGC